MLLANLNDPPAQPGGRSASVVTSSPQILLFVRNHNFAPSLSPGKTRSKETSLYHFVEPPASLEELILLSPTPRRILPPTDRHHDQVHLNRLNLGVTMSKYKRSGRPQSSRCKRTTRPRLEALESRLVLSSTVLPTCRAPLRSLAAGTPSSRACIATSSGGTPTRPGWPPGTRSSRRARRRPGRRSVLPVTRVHDRCGRVLLQDLSRPRRRSGGGRILGGQAPGGRERGGGRGSVPLLARVQRQARH